METDFSGSSLMIDRGGKIDANAEKLYDIANVNAEHIYIKSDGSLNDGFEIVTHPMTLDFHKEHMPWKAITQKALDMGYYSHNTNNLHPNKGIHRNISTS